MITYAVIFLAACGAAAATGAVFPPGRWYEGLKKPRWTPPKLAFPIMWTGLYIASAIAAARVAVSADPAPGLALWGLQIALNTLWTPVFFGAHRMGAAMAVIAALWAVLIATTLTFWRADAVAGALMVPYLGWITLASALNWRLWRDNA